MNFEVETIPLFERSAKKLRKRYRSFKEDLNELISSLEINPYQGDEISKDIRKIRLAITSKGRGKSGGARVITYTYIIDENSGKVYLIEIYDKADTSTVDVDVIKQIIKDLEI